MMKRAEIKKLAREKIKGNKWNVLWPFLFVCIVSFVVTTLAAKIFDGIIGLIACLVAGVIGVALNGSYFAFLLKFIRTGETGLNGIIACFAKRWIPIIVSGFLVGLFTFLWSLLLFIPGIIAALSYSMVGYLVVDTELSALEAIAASKRMMNGHKFEYFCSIFSFIGWNMLALPTAFFIYLWLFPYMAVTFAIYYDQLKNGDQYLKDRVANAQDADITNFDDIYAEEDTDVKSGDVL